ncbi:MAG: hydroxylase [Dehalococcoidia bacterium]|nr:hydroxylase [Dehalococcoidia bacterium]
MASRTSQRAAGAAIDGAHDPLAAAQHLRPRIQEMAPVIEAERRLPSELVEEMRAAGLFHMFLPRDLGGSETDPILANRVVEEVSAADGSAGWCVMLAGQSGLFSGYLQPEYAREVWGNGQIAAGTARPIGRAVVVGEPEAGYTVSGRWPFASGSSHADWFAAECMVYDGDEIRRDAAGNEVSRVTFVPRDQVTVHDTWDSLGLRGSASNDFSVDGAFVPAGRGFQVIVDQPVHPWAVFRALPLVFMTHGSQALGVARAALEAAIEVATTKRGWGGVPLSEVPRIQLVIAEATVTLQAARSYFYGTGTELWRAVQAGEDDDATARLRARTRLATSHAAQSSIRAVDMVHGALATSAIFKKSPLERQFRDIHTAGAHVMIGPMTYEAAGRVELGLAPDFPFF